MKKILFLLATAALLALGTSASAQRRSSRPAPSLTAGFITLSPTYCHSDGSTNDNFLTLAAGVRQLIPIQASTSLNLAYGADLEWMMYTGNNGREYLSYNQNLIGVKVPFSLVYKYDLNDEISFFPYVGLHVSGYLYGRASASAAGYSSPSTFSAKTICGRVPTSVSSSVPRSVRRPATRISFSASATSAR